MMARNREYSRLPGKRLFSLGGTSRLYVGKDHLLCRSVGFFVERYRRFYFADIQAVILNRTKAGMIWNVILGTLTALVALVVVLGDQEGHILGGIGLGLFLLMWLVHLGRGRTCSCRILTAVQTFELPSLVRLRPARKAIDVIKAHAEAAQGTIDPAELATGIPPPMPGAAAYAPAAAASAPGGAAEQPVRHEAGRAHALLFWMLLAVAGLNFLAAYRAHAVLDALILVALLGVIVSAAIAVARQRHSDIPGDLRKVAWMSIAGCCLVYVWTVVYATVRSFVAAMGVSGPTYQAQTAQMLPEGVAYRMICGTCALLLAVAGLIMLGGFRAKHPRREAQPRGAEAAPAPETGRDEAE